MGRHATLTLQAQRLATQYSPTTGQLLKSLVRELSPENAARLLELVRQIDDEVV